MIVALLLMQGRNYREQSPRFFIFKLPDICGTDLTIYGISVVDIVNELCIVRFKGTFLLFGDSM